MGFYFFSAKFKLKGRGQRFFRMRWQGDQFYPSHSREPVFNIEQHRFKNVSI
jgi:hypothetical protein